MLCPIDQMHIDYCRENNGGFCPYRHKVCDGVCNNCGLDVQPSKGAKSTCNGITTTIYPATELYFNEPI